MGCISGNKVCAFVITMIMIVSSLAIIPFATSSETTNEITDAAGFDWNLVPGWNLVSVPMEPTEKGSNGVFDAYDALENCYSQAPSPLEILDRIPEFDYWPNGFNYGQSEIIAFPMDGVHSYFVHTEAAGIIHFNATDWGPGINSVSLNAGWNALGFTHQLSWISTPTASNFTDGTIDSDLIVGGAAGNKIVASWWDHN